MYLVPWPTTLTYLRQENQEDITSSLHSNLQPLILYIRTPSLSTVSSFNTKTPNSASR